MRWDFLSPEESLCAGSQCGLPSTILCSATEGKGANLEGLDLPRCNEELSAGWCDCCCQIVILNLSRSCILPTPNPEFLPGSVFSATKGNCSALISVPHTEVQRGWTPGNRKCTWFKLHACDQCLGSNIFHFIKLFSSGRFWEQPPSWRLQIICKQDFTTWKLRFLFFFFLAN